jgi:hypothetical protein
MDLAALQRGAFTAFALTLLVFFADAKRYLLDVLPNYAAKVPPLREWSHSIPSAVGGGYGGFGWALNLCLLALWIWAGGRAVARGNAGLAFAGSLAYRRTSRARA